MVKTDNGIYSPLKTNVHAL